MVKKTKVLRCFNIKLKSNTYIIIYKDNKLYIIHIIFPIYLLGVLKTKCYQVIR